MELIATIMTSITTVVAVAGFVIAIIQLRGGRSDAKASRMADLSWRIYQEYEAEAMQTARWVLEVIANNDPVPQDGQQYYDIFINDQKKKHEVEQRCKIGSLHREVTRVLRFYHQIGILLNKNLIDPDFIFPLIGYGLQTSKSAITACTGFYQAFSYRALPTGHYEKGPRRDIYANAPALVRQFEAWQKSKGEDAA